MHVLANRLGLLVHRGLRDPARRTLCPKPTSAQRPADGRYRMWASRLNHHCLQAARRWSQFSPVAVPAGPCVVWRILIRVIRVRPRGVADTPLRPAHTCEPKHLGQCTSARRRCRLRCRPVCEDSRAHLGRRRTFLAVSCVIEQ